MPYQRGIDQLHHAFPDRSVPYIAYGSDFASLCATHIPSTLNASRVYILCSTSLATNTTALTRLTHAFKKAGVEVVGTRTGFRPHTHWNQILDCANDAAARKPDCFITLGAGSLTDACKVICWMLANQITTSEGLETLLSDSPSYAGDKLRPPHIRHVAIPTSLSGGEYQSIAGVTRDDGSDRKCLFTPPTMNPSLVILDPELVITTPERIWLSTGVRAIDHCVETLCSLLSNETGDREAEKALKKLIPSLVRTKREARDIDARFESMLGVIEAMSAVGSGVPMGASHAVGHQLGPLGVGHGETSCVMLPAVCKWNAAEGVNVERQEYCRNVLLEDNLTRELVKRKFGGGEADLGDVLDVIFRDLGMPRTLRDVGVGRDKMAGLAKNSLKDHWIKTNPKPIEKEEQVMEILEMVAE